MLKIDGIILPATNLNDKIMISFERTLDKAVVLANSIENT